MEKLVLWTMFASIAFICVVTFIGSGRHRTLREMTTVMPAQEGQQSPTAEELPGCLGQHRSSSSECQNQQDEHQRRTETGLSDDLDDVGVSDHPEDFEQEQAVAPAAPARTTPERD